MDTFILLAGLFVSILVVAGLILTVLEFRRLERQGYPVNPKFPL